MKIYTIGFTKKSARVFFGLLRDSGARAVVDVRLNNVSQLAGFAKRDDLAYFLESICQMDYVHIPDLAPTSPILDTYKKHGGSWSDYEQRFLALMHERSIERTIDPAILDNAVLLCSEERPDHCHRRLVTEYLSEHWESFEVVHLG